MSRQCAYEAGQAGFCLCAAPLIDGGLNGSRRLRVIAFVIANAVGALFVLGVIYDLHLDLADACRNHHSHILSSLSALQLHLLDNRLRRNQAVRRSRMDRRAGSRQTLNTLLPNQDEKETLASFGSY